MYYIFSKGGTLMSWVRGHYKAAEQEAKRLDGRAVSENYLNTAERAQVRAMHTESMRRHRWPEEVSCQCPVCERGESP